MKPQLLIIGFTLVLFGNRLLGFHYHVHRGDPIRWPSDGVTMKAHDDSFPPDSRFRTALSESIELWNENPSEFQFGLTFGERSVGLLGTDSEIWFTDSDYWLSGAPAITYTRDRRNEIRAKDILVDSREFFRTCHHRHHSLAYGGDRAFQTLVMHELGHAIGLAHEADEYNLMGQDWDHISVNQDTVHFYVGEDAGDGAVFLYGVDSPARQDVAVVHWKYSGSSGEYSTHTRTQIYRQNGSACSIQAGTADDPVFEVNRGDTILLELTFENNGADTQSPRVGYYLSVNSLITHFDRLLATRTPTVGRNDVYTTTQQLVIPNDITRNQTYYLGAVVDHDLAIPEVNEDNNATYVAIYVR